MKTCGVPFTYTALLVLTTHVTPTETDDAVKIVTTTASSITNCSISGDHNDNTTQIQKANVDNYPDTIVTCNETPFQTEYGKHRLNPHIMLVFIGAIVTFLFTALWILLRRGRSSGCLRSADLGPVNRPSQIAIPDIAYSKFHGSILGECAIYSSYGPPVATSTYEQNEPLVEPVYSICVHLPGGLSLHMSVRSTDEVRVIKTKVTELVKLPPHYVNVHHGLNHERSNILDGKRTFMDYGIDFGTDQAFTVTYALHCVLVQFADDRPEEKSWDPLLTVGEFFNITDLKSKAIGTFKDKFKIEVQWVGRTTLQEFGEFDTTIPLFHLHKVKVSVYFELVLKIKGQNTQMSVKVSPADTVNSLSKNFLVTVIFIYEGTQLASDKTLKDYGLQEGSVVTVVWPVTVSIAHGAQNYEITLLASKDVGEVKQMLADHTGIHRLEQHFSFNGNVLRDEKMLAEYLTSKMEDEMDITLTKQPWKVSVLLPTGTLRDYQVSPNNNVAFLKNQIEADADIPVSRQILQNGGNNLADYGLLCDSIVPSSSLIYLKEQIALKYSSNWRPVSVRWRPFFEELLQVSDGNLKEVNNVCFSTKIDKFKIGSGNRTEVFLGIRHDGREVAVKRFPRSMSQNFKNEKGLLTKLDSPNTIRYLDIAMDDEFLYLILELGEFTLNEFISTDEYKQNQSSISRDLVVQILESLRTLHTGHNVIHMDIKPHNVLTDANRRAKFSDFGTSVTLPDDQSSLYTTAKGTYRWVAKEILDSASGNTKYKKVKYKKSADIQVAGMLVYYTLTGGIHPFMPNGEADVFLCNKNVQDGKHDLSALKNIVGKHLVDWMLQPDPELRPTIEEALAHPFFWNADMRYRFLGVLGDEKEVKESWKQQPHSVTLTLDGLTASVFNTVAHWKDLLDQTVYDEFAKPMRNGYRSTICGLLRFIRNVDVHLKDKPLHIQATVGIPMTYFIARLPFDELFLKVYQTVRDTRSSADDWTVRGSLKEFFPA